ncbi:hypothetical protein ACROYT_G030532 [Oculina patagonica]
MKVHRAKKETSRVAGRNFPQVLKIIGRDPFSIKELERYYCDIGYSTDSRKYKSTVNTAAANVQTLYPRLTESQARKLHLKHRESTFERKSTDEDLMLVPKAPFR